MYTISIFFILFLLTYSITTPKLIQSIELDPLIDILEAHKINWSKSANIQLNSIDNKIHNFTLHTADNNTAYNGISRNMHVDNLNKIPFLFLSYATNSSIGYPTFAVEIRKALDDNNSNGTTKIESEKGKNERYLWSAYMGNTLGYDTTRVYQLPVDINNSDIQIRFYILSNTTTDAYVKLNNSTIFNL